MGDSARRRRIIAEALARQGGLCYWCDVPVGEATAEHLTPRHLGGRFSRDNIVVACPGCNHNRGPHDAPTETYVQMRRVTYLRAVGLYCEMPWRNGRSNEAPNFGYGPEGERLWAPQYGMVNGPPDTSRRQLFHLVRQRV
jgi:hypothetical protein